MNCKKCGAKLKKDGMFCPECGAKAEYEAQTQEFINSPVVQSIVNNSAVDAIKKMSKGKIIAIVSIVIFIGLILVACFGEGDTNNYSDEHAEQEILDILNTTPVADGFSGTIGVAVYAAFTDYNMEYNLVDGSDSTYNVVISGTYMPNPEVPYTQTGTITYQINIENETCRLYSDPNGIESVLTVYVVNYL